MNPLEKRCMGIVIKEHNDTLGKLEHLLGDIRDLTPDNVAERKTKLDDKLNKIINSEWNETRKWLGILKSNDTK